MSEEKQASEQLESSSKRSVSTAHSSDSLTIASFSSVLESAAAALGRSRIDHEQILQSSPAFHNLARNMIQLLELRACAWAKEANNAEELKDALVMIQIAPNYAAGYLRAGKVYRIQGYQGAAMETFKKGLDRVQLIDPDYAVLQQEYKLAEVQNRKQVDFISKCPYEVASRIISYLEDSYLWILDYQKYNTLVESVMVSRDWRDRLLGTPSPWRKFRIHSNKRIIRLLPAVTRHVEELLLRDNLRLIKRGLDLIQTHQFPKLHTLTVSRSYCKREDEDPYEDISGVLSALSKRLTDLHIFPDIITLPPLATILSMCPNLSGLSLAHLPDTNWLNGPYAATSLTYLSLSAISTDQESVDQVAELLRCSPALKHVEFDYYSADILPIIAQYCHNLTFIAYNRQQYYDESDKLQELENSSREHILILGGCFKMRSIQPLLDVYGSTLTTLFLSPIVPKNDTSDHGWHLLSTYSLSSLTELLVKDPSNVVAPFIGLFIRHNPTLKDITLNEIQVRDDIMRAIAGLNHIVSLTTTICYTGTTNFYILAQCQLRELNLVCNCDTTYDTLLMEVPAIKSLESLQVIVDYNNFEQDAELAEEFADSLGSLPCLKKVEISGILITDTAIRNLCLSKSLKTVNISSPRISKEGSQIFQEHGIKISDL